MNFDRRRWKFILMTGAAAVGLLAVVVMSKMSRPDRVLAEGEDQRTLQAAEGKFGASGEDGGGVIGAKTEDTQGETDTADVAGADTGASAGAGEEENPATALARERLLRENEAILAAEAAAREARDLALNGVIGQGLYEPDPSVLDKLGSATPETRPYAGTDGLGASLDPDLAALSGQSRDILSSASQEVTTPLAIGDGAGSGTLAAQSPDPQFGTGMPDVGYLAHDAIAARSPYEIKKGSVIPAVLITEVNSDLPGAVTAQVRDNVYDAVTGGTLLIPKGARLLGRYDSDIEYGQRRTVVLWSHLIFPDGSTLLLEDMMGTDTAGRSGFADKRRGDFLTMLAGNLLFSVIDAGERAAQAQIADITSGGTQQSDIDRLVSQVSRGASATGGSSAAATFNTQTSGAKPTLTVRTGYRFNVLVGKDIILDPWQG